MNLDSIKKILGYTEGDEHRFVALFRICASVLAALVLIFILVKIIPPADNLTEFVPQEATLYVHADARSSRILFSLPAGLLPAEAATYATKDGNELNWTTLFRFTSKNIAQARTILPSLGLVEVSQNIFSDSALPETLEANFNNKLRRARRFFPLTGFIRNGDKKQNFGALIASGTISGAFIDETSSNGQLFLSRALATLGADTVAPRLTPESILEFAGHGSTLPISQLLLPKASTLIAHYNLDLNPALVEAEELISATFTGPSRLSLTKTPTDDIVASVFFSETEEADAQEALLALIDAIPELSSFRLPDGSFAKELLTAGPHASWENVQNGSVLKDHITETVLYSSPQSKDGVLFTTNQGSLSTVKLPGLISRILFPEAFSVSGSEFPSFDLKKLSTVSSAVFVDKLIIFSLTFK